MTSATHDIAVQHLTDQQRFVRLVVQREIKGPLEPPQSPRSPLLKGLSPSGYLANRPSVGYKRTSDALAQHDQGVPQHTIENVAATKAYDHQQTPPGIHFDYTNGSENGVSQPVPAPRRLNSTNSIEAVNGMQANGNGPTKSAATSNASQSSGNKSEDEDAQVCKLSFVSCTEWFDIGCDMIADTQHKGEGRGVCGKVPNKDMR